MNDYQRQLGARLRAIRRQQGMTLQDVEAASDGRWKAVVVGSYERGDRALSVAKLAELGEFYGVPVSALLPESERDVDTTASAGRTHATLDLRALERQDLDPELQPLARFANTIQRQRGDYNGTVLTIRAEDLRALSVVFSVDMEELMARLDEEGVLVEA